MRTNVHKTAQLGELVAAVFDEAALFSSDPREVSRLARLAVTHMLRETQGTSPPPPPPTPGLFAMTQRFGSWSNDHHE